MNLSKADKANATALTVAFVLLGAAPAVHAADAEAGRQKAAVCAACHGEGGNSTNPAVPSIAQQPAQFVSTALFMFREGNRKDPQMSPMAANLSNEDMNDLAAFFSAQKAAPPSHKSDPENAKAGPGLAQKFNCTQCHGRGLLGQQHIPRLAGQQFEYLRTQLRGFKAMTRADIDGNMTSAARALSDKDIEVLSDFIAGAGAE
ncbi:MAG TPA: c-type cytochrome [Albitalea sp.]|nr:c-type cytochrome [Albitalea sp.]